MRGNERGGHRQYASARGMRPDGTESTLSHGDRGFESRFLQRRVSCDLIDVSTPVIAGQLLSSRGEKTAARGNCRATSVAARSSPDLMKAAVRLPAPPTRSRAPRRPAPRDIGTITAPATRPASLQGRAEGASAYAPGAIPPGSRLRPDWPVSLDLRHFADNRRPGGLYGADDGDRFRGYITRAPS